VINQEMRKLIKSILPEVGVGDLKIRSRGDNRCESANTTSRVVSIGTLQNAVTSLSLGGNLYKTVTA